MALLVNFDGSGSIGGDTEAIVDYAWNFGDATTGSGIAVSHTYPSAGDYNASLTVTNTCGRSDVSTQCVRVTEELPEICSWIDSKGGPTVLTITDIFELIDSFLFSTPPTGYTFVPTIQQVFGTIDYFLGFNGDAATGCAYYG